MNKILVEVETGDKRKWYCLKKRGVDCSLSEFRLFNRVLSLISSKFAEFTLARKGFVRARLKTKALDKCI